MRGFVVGRTLRHEHFADVFGIDVFLREHGEVARVVDRGAVVGEAHLVGVEAAHTQRAAEQARGVLAEGVHAGQHFNRLEGVGGGTTLFDGGTGSRGTSLAGVFLDQRAGAQLVAFAGDLHGAEFGGLFFVFLFRRGRRCCGGRRGRRLSVNEAGREQAGDHER